MIIYFPENGNMGCSKSHLATELHAFSLHHFQVLALAGDPCLPPHLGKKTMLKEKKYSGQMPHMETFLHPEKETYLNTCRGFNLVELGGNSAGVLACLVLGHPVQRQRGVQGVPEMWLGLWSICRCTNVYSEFDYLHSP